MLLFFIGDIPKKGDADYGEPEYDYADYSFFHKDIFTVYSQEVCRRIPNLLQESTLKGMALFSAPPWRGTLFSPPLRGINSDSEIERIGDTGITYLVVITCDWFVALWQDDIFLLVAIPVVARP